MLSKTRIVWSVGAAFLSLAMCATLAKAEDQLEQGKTEISSPLKPIRAGITDKVLFEELIAHNKSRQEALQEYTALRIYQVMDLKGKVHAREVGRMEFQAPDKKMFVRTSEEGSGMIRRLALEPLIASEIEAAAGKEHRNSSIAPDNYSIQLLGEQQIGQYNCFVAQVIPKRKDKYLFEGRVWIDTEDYAVVHIEGHPAKKLSFWIENAEIVRQYQKVDNFWLPERDETRVQVRLYGKKILTIDHQDYKVKHAIGRAETAQIRR